MRSEAEVDSVEEARRMMDSLNAEAMAAAREIMLLFNNIADKVSDFERRKRRYLNGEPFLKEEVEDLFITNDEVRGMDVEYAILYKKIGDAQSRASTLRHRLADLELSSKRKETE